MLRLDGPFRLSLATAINGSHRRLKEEKKDSLGFQGKIG